MAIEYAQNIMLRALELAREAEQLGEIPVGAIITCSGEIVAEGHNLPRSRNDPTAHAEMIAIRAAAAKLGKDKLINCDLWVTLEPCTMCAGAISMARLKRLYYAADDPKGGAVENGVRFFDQPTCHHTPEIYSGILADPAAKILGDFFKNRR